MAHYIEVTDADDPRLVDYTDLTDVALRKVREPAEGLFMAEGSTVIRRAVEAGYPMRSVLASRRWADDLDESRPDPRGGAGGNHSVADRVRMLVRRRKPSHQW